MGRRFLRSLSLTRLWREGCCRAPYGRARASVRVLKFDGAVAPRVLKFDSGSAAEGCGGRLRRGRDRDRDLGGAFQYSRRLTPCGRGLIAPPGLTALGAKGSACDRLRLTGGLRAPALGSYYSIAALARYGAFGAISYAAFGGENHTTALRARKCNPPLVAGATTLPGGKHVTGFAGREAPL